MAAQPAREVVHEGGRWVLHRRQVDVVRRLAPRALDLQPGKPPFTAWSMVGDGSIGSPSLHIRSFELSHGSLSAYWIGASPLARISADRVANMLAIARALPSSLSPPDRGVG
jgi:hypothetical protein